MSLHVPGIDRQRLTLASRFNRSARLWRGNRLGRKGLRQTTSMDSIGGPEGPVPNFSTIHDSFGRFCRWQRATTRSGRQRSLHEISADLAAGGCVAEHTGRPHQAAQNLAAVGRARLAGNLLRPTQIATCPVVPLTGPLSLLDFGVVPEVEPFQTTTRTNHLEVGWVAIVSRCDVVGDVRDLSAEGVVEGLSRPSLALGTLRSVEACQK